MDIIYQVSEVTESDFDVSWNLDSKLRHLREGRKNEYDNTHNMDISSQVSMVAESDF